MIIKIIIIFVVLKILDMSYITFYVEDKDDMLIKYQRILINSETITVVGGGVGIFYTLNLKFTFKDDFKTASNIETIRVSRIVKITTEKDAEKEKLLSLENEIDHRNLDIGKLMTERQKLLNNIDDSDYKEHNLNNFNNLENDPLENAFKETIEEIEFKTRQIALHKRKIKELRNSDIEIKYETKTEHYFIDLHPGVKKYFSYGEFLIKISYVIDCVEESQNTSFEILDPQTLSESITYSNLNKKVRHERSYPYQRY